MATVKLVLHKSNMFKDGTYPLVFQIIHNRRKKIIYTKYRIAEVNLDIYKGKVCYVDDGSLSSKTVQSINRDLRQQLKAITERIDKLDYLGVDYSVNDLDNNRSSRYSPYLMQYIQAQINNKLVERREGTASAYRNTMMSMNRYLEGHDVRVSNVTPTFVRKYESFLTTNQVTVNTIAFYMRNLKTLFNTLINDNHYLQENPFKITRTSISKTPKRALSRKDLIRLVDLTFDLKSESHLDFARDFFMFSYYTRGMSLVDIVYLKKTQIVDGIIFYARKKSKQQIRIRVTQNIQALITKYDSNSDYVLPILDLNSSRSLYAQYRLALGRINHNLKIVGLHAKLSTPLTSYMARHSWATQAKEVGTPISVISEGLGHTSEQITRIYLKEFDSSVIDKANELVTRLK